MPPITRIAFEAISLLQYQMEQLGIKKSTIIGPLTGREEEVLHLAIDFQTSLENLDQATIKIGLKRLANSISAITDSPGFYKFIPDKNPDLVSVTVTEDSQQPEVTLRLTYRPAEMTLRMECALRA